MRKIQLSISILLFCMLIIRVNAQKPEDIKLSKNLVIENVMLVKNPGATPTKSTIVIQNGVITQLGNNGKIPANSITIKGDSLFAYSAFIDACSHTGVPKPDKDEKFKDVKDPDKPGWKRAGITPQATISETFNANDSSVKDMREAGFAISHTVPRGRMLPGNGSIILLSEGTNASYIKENASMYGSLQSAKGRVYPSTVIAVMAKYREIMKQARISQKHEAKYSANPIGLKRPNYPKEIQSLYPVVAGSQPFFMRAEKTLDISRAIALNKDLGLKMTIVEAKQAWHNLDKLKKNNISLLLSLDIPDDIKEEKDSTTFVDSERAELIVRRKTAIKEYQSQFKVMKDSNIPVSFSFLETKPKDIHKNLMKLIEKEVKPTDLHAALTTNPAKLLGIQNIAGTIEQGKLGNIILTDKALFEKDMNIHYTIVEGEMYKHEVKEKKKKKKKKDGDKSGESIDISGKWDITVSIPGNEQTSILVLEKDGEEYTGTLTSDDDEETTLEDIEFDGENLTFTLEITDNGMTLEVEIDAELEGDNMKGSASVGEFGTFPLEGTKKADPKN